MPSDVRLLPAATKKHLFNLVTNSAYRSRASKATYTLRGEGSPGTPVTKYGWDGTLPAGTEQRREGQPDPGKYRLASYERPLRGTFWYKMEHVGSNSYKFDPIAKFPVCPMCKGTGQMLCPDCKGTGRTVDGRLITVCTKCLNTSNRLKSGVLECSNCHGLHVANGATVDPTEAHW
jgi:hypothetical protein